MFIDSSAFCAFILGEADGGLFAERLERAPRPLCTSPVVVLETVAVLSTRLGIGVEQAHDLVRETLATAEIEIVPLSDEVGRIAISALARFGKGRGGRAQLNLADCLSYACAKAYGLPLLYKGEDFTHTDIEPA